MLKLCLILLLCFFETGCSPKKAPSDIQKIMDKGTLVVALYHKDMPPFFFKDENGEMVGVDIDLAKAISKELGVKLVFNRKAKKFDEVVDVVAAVKQIYVFLSLVIQSLG